MSMLHLKNLPESVKKALRRRAREEGTTMSDYVLRLIKKDLERPSPHEILRRLEKLRPIEGLSGAQLVEEVRREREKELGW